MDDTAWQTNGENPVKLEDAPPSAARDDIQRSPPKEEERNRGRSRSCSPGASREERGRGENPGNNLHVSGLITNIDTRELESTFAQYGRVKKAAVMYDPHTRESRGFGFVTMETQTEAERAIAALDSTDLHGKLLRVERAHRGRARTPTPGHYFGPPKRTDVERPYDPRPYDSRYSRDYERDDQRGSGRYERSYRESGRYDRDDRRYESERSRYDERDRDRRYQDSRRSDDRDRRYDVRRESRYYDDRY